LSSNAHKKFLQNILKELARHEDLYKLVEFKSVVAKREDISGREKKWHNYITLIKMLHSGTPRPWEKQLEKDNLAILSTVTTVDRFREILERLVNEEVLEVDGYQAFGPFRFSQRVFLDSKQSRPLYNIDCAANFWSVAQKDKLGLPSDESLELQSGIVPFEHAGDAIRYHTGLSHEGYVHMQHSIHIVAPLYYAKIENVDLTGQEILVKIDCKSASIQDLEIKYNTEGVERGSQYYSILEADTLQPDEDTTTIYLKRDAERATIWLHHKKGFVIDSYRRRKTPSFETIERELASGNQYLLEEGANVITEIIHSRSKANISDLMTTEQGVDSIDIEILKAVKTIGGDYADCIPEVLKYLSLNRLLSRLARLRTLGFLTLQPPRKILLTSLGLDALNLPPAILSAKVPPEVGRRIAEIKLAFRDENYDEVTNKSTRLIEAILKKRLEEKFSGTFQDVWPNLNLGQYNRASLGTLKEACLKLKIFKKNELADHMLSIILKLRVPMSHEKEVIPSPPNVAMLTVQLVEAFVREWYYLEL